MGALISRVVDLPPGRRRESFVWAHAWRRGFSLTADLSGWPDQCAWFLGEHRRRPVVIVGAVQDAGGLWHLVGSSRCCTTSMATAHRRRVVAETADAGSIPPALRCSQGRAVWPGYTGAGTRHRAYRVAAIAYLGESCTACRSRPGQVIDHDHITGLSAATRNCPETATKLPAGGHENCPLTVMGSARHDVVCLATVRG